MNEPERRRKLNLASPSDWSLPPCLVPSLAVNGRRGEGTVNPKRRKEERETRLFPESFPGCTCQPDPEGGVDLYLETHNFSRFFVLPGSSSSSSSAAADVWFPTH